MTAMCVRARRNLFDRSGHADTVAVRKDEIHVNFLKPPRDQIHAPQHHMLSAAFEFNLAFRRHFNPVDLCHGHHTRLGVFGGFVHFAAQYRW